MEVDKFQGIFDQGFSGLFEDSNRKLMPDYIEKLAESEINYEPPVLETPNITFDDKQGLIRANELTSDVSRESSRENHFTAEKTQREAAINKVKDIDKLFENALASGKSFEEAERLLLNKISKQDVQRYLESKNKLILDNFSFLGFESLNEKQANILEQMKVDYKTRRANVHEILEKFSKLEFVSDHVIDEYKNLLNERSPIFVASKFLFSLNKIKKDFYSNKEARTAFKRDIDEKVLTLRDVNNNLKKNSTIQKQKVFSSIFNDYKDLLFSKKSKSEINKKLSKQYGFDTFQDFMQKHKDDILKTERFYERKTFDSDFSSSALQGVEVNFNFKASRIDSKQMLNFSLDLLTQGESLDFVKTTLSKKFGSESANEFLKNYEYKLQRHYGQIGYLFIDSNIYSSCDEMASSFSKLQHAGSKLIFSLKSNSKCSNCSLNKEGTCSKTDLLISNNPVSRSSRAAKRVFNKAASFVPKEYINPFIEKIKADESNLNLISEFTLGIKSALEEEGKNIGKRASKDRSVDPSLYDSFANIDTKYDVNIFNESGKSSIVDDILNEQ